MPTGLWRVLALVFGLLSLGVCVTDAATWHLVGDDHVTSARIDGNAARRVTSVTGTTVENGGILPGDVVIPRDGWTPRERLGDETPGTTIAWQVTRGSQTFATTSRVSPPEPTVLVLIQIFNVVRLAMIAVGLLLAVRRPDAPDARALATFLIGVGVTIATPPLWIPDPYFLVTAALHAPIQLFALAQGVYFGCIYPYRSETGVRAFIRRVNPWVTVIVIAQTFVEQLPLIDPHGAPLFPTSIETFARWTPMYFFVAIAVAFGAAVVGARGADRQRVAWAAGSLGLGFAGPIVQIVAFVSGAPDSSTEYLPLTLVAIPAGLAYTILRHRTIDIGFVISRALVLTIVSFIIVAAFGLLERALGKIFIDASHIASRTVEIGLAIGLGFSLRSLHAWVERGVDSLFFRERRRALGALRDFAAEVFQITDPDVAVERTIAIVSRSTGAENVAVYLIADGVFGCAIAADGDGFPAEVSENDRLFVRMRATRGAESPRRLESELVAEIAFPMFVRGTLVGALVLAQKHSGEAYDPEENALLTDVAQRVGVALDALQTLALRRELEARIVTYDRIAAAAAPPAGAKPNGTVTPVAASRKRPSVVRGATGGAGSAL